MKVKMVLLVVMLSMLSGCGKLDRWVSGITGDASEVCVSGVTYLQFTSGAALKVDRSGNPVACN